MQASHGLEATNVHTYLNTHIQIASKMVKQRVSVFNAEWQVLHDLPEHDRR